jgi:hypothetical protein
MGAPETSAKFHRRFGELAEELSHRGVSVAKMSGVPSFKAHGKAIGCLWGDPAVFKLPPHEGGDRGPHAHTSTWPGLASQALDYLTGG